MSEHFIYFQTKEVRGVATNVLLRASPTAVLHARRRHTHKRTATELAKSLAAAWVLARALVDGAVRREALHHVTSHSGRTAIAAIPVAVFLVV